MARHFTEGWVEFESKRAAKQLVAKLNNSPIATRKSSKFYDILWSMKYLPRFKWTHLSERLTYEKAVHRQKLQTEIGQARKEAAFFQDNLDKSDKFKRLNKKANKAKKDAVKADEWKEKSNWFLSKKWIFNWTINDDFAEIAIAVFLFNFIRWE